MGRQRSGTPALRALEAAGIAHRIHGYEHDPRAASFAMEAAELLGFAPERVFKTLLGVAEDATLVVGIVPAAAMLDLKALATATGHKKVAMADPAVAERSTGMVVGGISPIGQKRRLSTVLDDSALLHDTILVSGGRRGLDVELSPGDLLAVTGASTWAIATRR